MAFLNGEEVNDAIFIHNINNPLIVEYTEDSASETFADVIAAIQDGQKVIAKFENENYQDPDTGETYNPLYLTCVGTAQYDGTFLEIIFSAVVENNIVTLRHCNDESITTDYQAPETAISYQYSGGQLVCDNVYTDIQNAYNKSEPIAAYIYGSPMKRFVLSGAGTKNNIHYYEFTNCSDGIITVIRHYSDNTIETFDTASLMLHYDIDANDNYYEVNGYTFVDIQAAILRGALVQAKATTDTIYQLTGFVSDGYALFSAGYVNTPNVVYDTIMHEVNNAVGRNINILPINNEIVYTKRYSTITCNKTYSEIRTILNRGLPYTLKIIGYPATGGEKPIYLGTIIDGRVSNNAGNLFITFTDNVGVTWKITHSLTGTLTDKIIKEPFKDSGASNTYIVGITSTGNILYETYYKPGDFLDVNFDYSTHVPATPIQLISAQFLAYDSNLDEYVSCPWYSGTNKYIRPRVQFYNASETEQPHYILNVYGMSKGFSDSKLIVVVRWIGS